jgi:hypothetical protein
MGEDKENICAKRVSTCAIDLELATLHTSKKVQVIMLSSYQRDFTTVLHVSLIEAATREITTKAIQVCFEKCSANFIKIISIGSVTLLTQIRWW